MGSFAERQDFSRSEAKPPFRLQDRASAPLMTGDGWNSEWQLGIRQILGKRIGNRRQGFAAL
jgi:hypothetical protein